MTCEVLHFFCLQYSAEHKKGVTVALKKEFTKEEVEQLIDLLSDDNNIVRLVDPLSEFLVNSDGTLQMGNICRSVWGRPHRCENCSSLRALQTQEVLYKMEFCDDRIYWIISRYLNVEGHDCVLEFVVDTTDSIIIEGGSADQISEIIEGYNNQVVFDSLTGVFNRNYLDTIFLPTVGFRRASQMPIHLAVVDLDNFKDVNDTYGHAAGDKLLTDVGGFWKARFDSRKKNKERLTIRYGGDEMLVVCCEGSYDDFVKEIEEGYNQMRKSCYINETTTIPFTLSYGTASTEEMVQGAWMWEDLFNRADERMYAMKEQHHAEAANA